MKKILTILFFLITANTFATTYYFAASGSDANAGTSPGAPWQTLAKFNSVFSTIVPGDNVLFNRGDVFYGSITINKSGTSGHPITIGAYGTGANPIITGLVNVVAFTNLGSNIWQSTFAVTPLSTLNMVVINGVNTPMGRYPNSGFLTFQAHSSNTAITSSSLTGTPNWTGAQLILRSIRWMLERNKITSQSGGTLTYTGGSSPGTNGFGFFIQNDERTLDAQNEWYFDPSTKKLKIYSASIPLNVQVPAVDELVINASANFVTIDHIDIQGANTALYDHRNGRSCIFQNCHLRYSGSNGIWINPATSANATITISNNTIDDCNQYAINSNSYTSNTLIQNNVINNTNMIPGSGTTSQTDGDAILMRGPGSICEYNTINNSGHNAINIIQNDNLTARYNYITNFGMTRYDAGGVYSWNPDSISTPTGRFIDHNIIANSNQVYQGVSAGTDGGMYGVYLDGSSKNTHITNNTISNCKSTGILVLNSGGVTITGNTCYDNGNFTDQGDAQMTFKEDTLPAMKIKGMIVNNNILFSKVANEATFAFRNDNTKVFNVFGVANNNYYARPIDDNLSIRTTIHFTNTMRALAGWQALSGQDSGSHKSPVTISDVSKLRFYSNPSQSPLTVALDANYIDVANVAYNGTITLAPYTAAVLIYSSALANVLPSANAGTDQTITLPTNSVSLAGIGTDADGTVVSTVWSQISGPNTATLTASTNPNTNANGLIAGTYLFQFTVTDNSGGTASDVIQVIVNAAPNVAPTANAGSNQTITLPTSTATLSGSGTDTDGSIVSYSWSKISGPGAGTITSASSASTTVTGMVQGVYTFQLTVTDNLGATGVSSLQVTVNDPANASPTANAGIDQSIQLPAALTLSGSGTDTDGTIAAYAWTRLSGPNTPTIVSASSATTTVTGLIPGTYNFQLTVTDNLGAQATDNIQVIVAAANIAPVANAGIDKSITLPTSSTSLSGSGFDADGSISSYA